MDGAEHSYTQSQLIHYYYFCELKHGRPLIHNHVPVFLQRHDRLSLGLINFLYKYIIKSKYVSQINLQIYLVVNNSIHSIRYPLPSPRHAETIMSQI